MSTEQVFKLIESIGAASHPTYESLAQLAVEMRRCANDLNTPVELVGLFDDCSAYIECFIAMTAPAVERIEQTISRILAVAAERDPALLQHEAPEAIQ